MTTRIFIGSSMRDKGACSAIGARLRELGFDARPWVDVFGPDGKFILERFELELTRTDYCLFLVSGDIDGHRRTDRSPSAAGSPPELRPFANPNVIFEMGASFARLGRSRTFIVHVGTKVEGLSELGGLLTYQLKEPYETSDILALCEDIARQVKKARWYERTHRMRWLTLMRCRPSLQSRVVNTLIANEHCEVFARCDVRFERHGVVWGPPDVFLLFTVPGPGQFEVFLRELRTLLQGLVDDVDSRMVFPSSFLAIPPAETDGNHERGAKSSKQNLIFLSCQPNKVEVVFQNIGKYFHEAPPKHGGNVRLLASGILTGEDDVFLITQTRTEDEHYAFVQSTLQKDIAPAHYLVKNTTSMAITPPLAEDR